MLKDLRIKDSVDKNFECKILYILFKPNQEHLRKIQLL
jgi:hypothetical protein